MSHSFNSNRPWDIDKAFLRRLPCTFLVDLPVMRSDVIVMNRMKNKEKLSYDIY